MGDKINQLAYTIEVDVEMLLFQLEDQKSAVVKSGFEVEMDKYQNGFDPHHVPHRTKSIHAYGKCFHKNMLTKIHYHKSNIINMFVWRYLPK